MKRIVWLVATAAAFALALTRTSPAPPRAFELDPVGDSRLSSKPSSKPSSEPVFETGFASSGSTPSVHSATAVELDAGTGGGIRAFWYGGSREGARDVAIYTSVLDADTGQWNREVAVTTREQTQADVGRYVKKLGNPVVSRDGDGRMWLFYVSVSVGGWSGSAINYRISDDEGESWSSAKRLVTSPFLNISTLVRGPAVRYTDGTQGVPVYHELVGKFSELLRVDREGRVLDKARMSAGYSSLQPVVLPLDDRRPERALGLMRSSGNSPPRVLAVRTEDGGSSWSTISTTPLANPDAAVAALRLSSGELVIAFNDSEQDRSNLSLAVSEDEGDSWELVHVVEPPGPPREAAPRFAYPWLLESTTGEVHLFYTWERERIAHVRFNRAWLRRSR